MQRRKSLTRIYWIAGVIALLVVIYLGTVLLLNPSSVGNRMFVWQLNLWAIVWAVNFLVISVLLFILARDVIKLFFEYQGNRPGSRIKSKLVLTLIIFSFFPALIMLFLNLGLMNRNLKQWFSSPAEQLLESSRVISEQFYAQRRGWSLSTARSLAAGVAAGVAPDTLFSRPGYRDFAGLALYDSSGKRLQTAGEWGDRAPSAQVVREVLGGSEFYRVWTNQQPDRIVPGATRLDRGLVGVPIQDGDRISGAVFARFEVPESVLFHTMRVEDAVAKYRDTKSRVQDFETNYFATLAFTTLAIVFGFVWLGNYIAKRMTVPLEAVAEASRRLAEGDFDHRVEVKAVDELGILIDSFNRMAEHMRHSRQALEKANDELRTANVRLEERRAYIETVLQNIATGVVTIDESDVIRTVNEAAAKIFRTRREGLLNKPLTNVVDSELYSRLQKMKARARLYGSYRSELTFTFAQDERQLHVAATVTRNSLPGPAGEEYLVVLDDLTEFIDAEKFAAWQEVARRLAHEIKNPLTPIQLSAERLKKRFERIPAELARTSDLRDFSTVLDDAVSMIVAESEMLKSLVQEFSKFARLPICKPADVNLHELIDRTLSLYDGALGAVKVCREYDPKISTVRIDPEQMQRVFVNLADNALDALGESEGPRLLVISTRLNESRNMVRIEVQDNGIGIAPGDYEQLFLPYFSTKRKGTGLGLAIVRQIITEHNGAIRAEPNSPRGTRIVIELPVANHVAEKETEGYARPETADR